MTTKSYLVVICFLCDKITCCTFGSTGKTKTIRCTHFTLFCAVFIAKNGKNSDCIFYLFLIGKTPCHRLVQIPMEFFVE